MSTQKQGPGRPRKKPLTPPAHLIATANEDDADVNVPPVTSPPPANQSGSERPPKQRTSHERIRSQARKMEIFVTPVLQRSSMQMASAIFLRAASDTDLSRENTERGRIAVCAAVQQALTTRPAGDIDNPTPMEAMSRSLSLCAAYAFPDFEADHPLLEAAMLALYSLQSLDAAIATAVTETLTKLDAKPVMDVKP